MKSAALSIDSELHIPTKLSVNPTRLSRVLVIGSCFAQVLAENLASAFPGCAYDYLLANYAHDLPDDPPQPVDTYDFIVVMLPLRSVMPETGYLRISYLDTEAATAFYENSIRTLEFLVDATLKYTRQCNKMTFVLNYLTPNGNYLGRLLPRRDLRNPAYFCEQLNVRLDDIVSTCPSGHIIDLNEIGNAIGKRWIHDDALVVASHGAFINEWFVDQDYGRLHRTPPITQQFSFLASSDLFHYVWLEIATTYRILRQTDAIKLVVTDLDDTLWRGVALEHEQITDLATEGWPSGYIEALQFLKKRGVLLGIISKNDRTSIEQLWPRLCRGWIELTDFAAVKINWEPKPTNMEQVLTDLNLLPSNALFIDDNPVERSAMKAAFPTMRVIGDNPYELRRLLLWSSETQVPQITNESGRRTEMVQAQIERENDRKKMSREEFLQTLAVRMELFLIETTADSRFARAFELINKTNQFNTTGKRWTHEEIEALIAGKASILAFEVEDKYTRYGLVGVVIEKDGELLQFVMSCRVVGLDVELAAIALISNLMRLRGCASLKAIIARTSVNALCQDVWQRCGFKSLGDGVWQMDIESEQSIPAHISSAQ